MIYVFKDRMTINKYTIGNIFKESFPWIQFQEDYDLSRNYSQREYLIVKLLSLLAKCESNNK